MLQKDTLPITVDKSHLITIGEKLYAQSIELIRELVNNAYDADAAVVEVNISEDRIEVKDNGSGMDLEGLKQYFNIGSRKRSSTPSLPGLRGIRSDNSALENLPSFLPAAVLLFIPSAGISLLK